MHRRDFVVASLAFPTLAHALGIRPASLQLGYAAITWGGQDDVAVDEIASLGFRGIQLRTAAYARWGANPAALTELLARRRLTFVAFSSGMLRLAPATFEDDMALHLRHARFVRACGGRFLQVVDERPRQRTPTSEDHAAMARRLSELGARVADLGLTLAYHNHMGNLGQAPDEVAAVLSRCDPRHVRFLLDIAHWQAAGGDPVAAVREYADRLAFLHLKDLAPAPSASPGGGVRFVELGRGVVDVPGVLAELARRGYDGWGIVELDGVTDPSLTPIACARISRDYLASIGYTP
jgi:inosose dehydratase